MKNKRQLWIILLGIIMIGPAACHSVDMNDLVQIKKLVLSEEKQA